jgi:hypothetical protein
MKIRIEGESLELREWFRGTPDDGCANCQGENAKTGYVELWDGVCPDCSRVVQKVQKVVKKKMKPIRHVPKERSEPLELAVFVCPECGEEGSHYAKGFCHSCYEKFQAKKRVTEMPKLRSAKVAQELIESVLQHVANTKGTLRLAPDGQMFGFEYVKEWQDFCIELLQISPALSAHFGIQNKWKLEGRGKDLIIKYG